MLKLVDLSGPREDDSFAISIGPSLMVISIWEETDGTNHETRGVDWYLQGYPQDFVTSAEDILEGKATYRLLDYTIPCGVQVTLETEGLVEDKVRLLIETTIEKDKAAYILLKDQLRTLVRLMNFWLIDYEDAQGLVTL